LNKLTVYLWLYILCCLHLPICLTVNHRRGYDEACRVSW